MFRQFFMGAVCLLAACGAPRQSEPAAEVRTPVEEGERIELLVPDSTGGAAVDEALWLRRSSREYSGERLSLEELSGVMWAAAGINRAESAHLTAPSALALYPVRVYAFLEGGAYLYDAGEMALLRIAEGDFRELTARQEFAYAAPLNLVYVADTGVYEGRDLPAEKVRYLCGQDAAGYAENVNLYAAGHGLKSITRGSCKEAEVLDLLRLDSVRYFVALAQTVGR